jgi:hypothetical protein
MFVAAGNMCELHQVMLSLGFDASKLQAVHHAGGTLFTTNADKAIEFTKPGITISAVAFSTPMPGMVA